MKMDDGKVMSLPPPDMEDYQRVKRERDDAIYALSEKANALYELQERAKRMEWGLDYFEKHWWVRLGHWLRLI